MKKISTDTLIIGGGPAGYPAAIRLGQLKKSVILAEKGNLGGTCLNIGCIPSKALIGVASKYYLLKNQWSATGINTKGSSIDWKKTIDWKEKVVTKVVGGVGQLLKYNKVDHLQGHCKIIDKNSCQVGEDTEVIFNNLILATGSKVMELKEFKFDHKLILDSTDLLNLPEIPKSMIILGGGIIGMELGTLYACLGCKITIVEMLPSILTVYEKEARNIVHKAFEEMGGTILTSTKALSFKKSKNGEVVLKIEKEKQTSSISADKLAVAVGRKSNFDDLNIEGLNLEMQGNRIVVNDKLQTSTPHIYAVGDIIPGPMLAHKATMEGVLAAEVIAGHKVSSSDVKIIPDVVYTKPEIAQVGYNRDKALEMGIPIKIGKFPLTALGIAATSLETKGYVEYIAEEDTNKIVGATIVSTRASDMISEAALAIEMGASLDDIGLTVHPHPSFGEAHMEAALAGLSKAIHILNK